MAQGFHEVVIAGGGPTGLMLAAELQLAGVEVVVIERRANQDLDGSRAGGLSARTLEVLDQRGVVDRFLAEGQVMQVAAFAYNTLDISDLPSRRNHGLALWQRDFERILADWVLGDLAVPIRRSTEVVGFAQDDDGVDVELSTGETVRAAHLVGCDGGRSVVRKVAGIDFAGLEPTTSWMIAEAEFDGEPELGFRRDAAGRQQVLGQRQPGEPVRAVLTEATADRTEAPTLDELRAALIDIYGTDFGLRSAAWISWFTDAVRQAVAYRSGRVLLAGDAAHVHPPHGGQGLNVGVQDAVNLGWKLAQVVHGTSPDSLLDTYHDERHPVGARAIEATEALVALASPGERHEALRSTVAELLAMDEPRRRMGARMSGLDIAYDLGGDHPLVGRRVPDLDLVTADGPTRVYELLHDARPLLLDLRGPGAAAVDVGRVRQVAAAADGPWDLPLIGEVSAPEAVLVRPDGHVAWVGQVDDPTLTAAVTGWFGGE